MANYPLPTDTILTVEAGQEMHPGDVMAKIPQEVTKSKDITGGLPRVSELFEARRPKSSAIISEIEGIVSPRRRARRTSAWFRCATRRRTWCASI